MMNDEEFEGSEEFSEQFSPRKRRQTSGVIKSGRNHVKGIVHLDPGNEDQEGGVEFFQPIYEGDTIVGVMHKCACGKTSELRFQYTDN